MSTRLVWAGTNVEARWLEAPWYVLHTVRTWDLEVWCLTAYAAGALRLAADVASWVAASLNGGSSYTALGTSVQSGMQLGAATAGQRIAVRIKLDIPAGTATLSRLVGIDVGEGVD